MANKYINADEFRIDLLNFEAKDYFTEETKLGIRFAINTLDILPAADVVEVVRCKDCKYHKSDNEMNFNYCKFHGVYINTDFCADGERRESE